MPPTLFLFLLFLVDTITGELKQDSCRHFYFRLNCEDITWLNDIWCSEGARWKPAAVCEKYFLLCASSALCQGTQHPRFFLPFLFLSICFGNIVIYICLLISFSSPLDILRRIEGARGDRGLGACTTRSALPTSWFDVFHRSVRLVETAHNALFKNQRTLRQHCETVRITYATNVMVRATGRELNIGRSSAFRKSSVRCLVPVQPVVECEPSARFPFRLLRF